MLYVTSINAQYTVDVRVHKDPDYTKYGVQYHSITQPETRKVPDPYEMNRKNSEINRSILSGLEANERALMEGNKVVSEDIQLLNGINLSTKLSTPIRAKVTTKKNGSIEITCLGIKNGQNWKPCDKPIISLNKMYKSATSESEKSMILDLMDLGNYLLDTGSELFIIK